MELIRQHIQALEDACLNHKVESLFVFGSILTENFHSESDIDFIVSIHAEDPIEYGEHYFELKFELEKILGRKIDLLEQKAIRNPEFLKLINPQKVLVYGSGNKGLA